MNAKYRHTLLEAICVDPPETHGPLRKEMGAITLQSATSRKASYDLTPAFPTDRTLLRIHPDGGRLGSEGCIALKARREQLQDFAARINAYLRAYGMIPVLVNQ